MTERIVHRPQFIDEPAAPYRSHEIHPKAFTPRQCAAIVALADDLVVEDATLEADDGDEVADDGIRRSRTAWIPPEDRTWWIYERLARVAERANRRYGFELSGFAEDLQLTLYDEPGAFYSWHQDGLDGAVAGRKLSIVVQLSDPADYEGGELELFDIAEDVAGSDWGDFVDATGAQGTAVVFPSFEYHRVLPLRAGRRFSLVAWVGGPPFR